MKGIGPSAVKRSDYEGPTLYRLVSIVNFEQQCHQRIKLTKAIQAFGLDFRAGFPVPKVSYRLTIKGGNHLPSHRPGVRKQSLVKLTIKSQAQSL